MPRCIVFCAAPTTRQDLLLANPQPGDLLIAADAGYLQARALGVTPHAILGDFDSAPLPDTAGVEVFPIRKDDTDSLLAIKHGLAQGIREFVLLGALGGPRLDHTLANLQCLGFVAQAGGQAWAYAGETAATAICNTSLTLQRQPGVVSVFALGGDCTGVTLKGLQYPLCGATLTAHFPLGVSNAFAEEQASISVQQGTLLVMTIAGTDSEH